MTPPTTIHWIDLKEYLQETPIFNGKNHDFPVETLIFNGKNHDFPVDVPLNQSNETSFQGLRQWPLLGGWHFAAPGTHRCGDWWVNSKNWIVNMAMDQYLLIPFLVG